MTARYSEAQKRAVAKYQKKAYDTTLIRFKKETPPTLPQVQEAADAAGESLNAYITGAITQRMEREKKGKRDHLKRI